MPNFFPRMVSVAFHQVHTLGKWLKNEPIYLHPLAATTIDQDDIDIVRKWLNNEKDWEIDDPVFEFGRAFAEWNCSGFAYAFSSGRVALNACIHGLGLLPGDEVIIPAYTCIVVANAFKFAGIAVKYCDIELDTYGLDVELLKNKITEKTKAVVLQHLYGLVSRDYLEIIKVCKNKKIKVIEDCAQSTGALFGGRKVGNLGDCGFYSFEQSKVMCTVRGGMATTNDPLIAKRINAYFEGSPRMKTEEIKGLLQSVIILFQRNQKKHGWWKGDLEYLIHGKKFDESTTLDEINQIQPLNYRQRMAAPIASLGLNQLSKIDVYNEKRRKTANIWIEWCKKKNFSPAMVLDGSQPIYLRFPFLVKPEMKQNTRWLTRELKVQPGVWFVGNLHPTNIEIQNCPNAAIAVKQCVNLPGLIK